MNSRIIIFSKIRTLQLKSLLLSIRKYGDIDETKIDVLYVENSEISYKPLIKTFKCNFVHETDFLNDLKQIIYNADSEYICFMVDDLIFRDSFNCKKIEAFLDERKDIDSFTLRLGKNINAGRMPEFEVIDNEILVWNTSADLGRYWNYFWELCSSFYRKKLVLKYLSKCRQGKETFPNPFEFHYYSCMPSTHPTSQIVKAVNTIRFLFKKKSNRMACFMDSKCFTQGVNLVAEINDVRQEIFNPLTLHKKMEEGYIVDYKYLKNIKPESPNPGHKYFKLIKECELN